MEDLSEQAINGAIELLVGGPRATPKAVPSCSRAAKMLLLHMESIDSTRKQVAHALTFIRAFKEGTSQEPPPPVNPQESYSGTELQAIVQAALTSLWKQKIWYQVSKSNCSQFLEKLIAA